MYLVKTVIVVLGLLGLFEGVASKYFLWQKIEKTLLKLSDFTNFKGFFVLAFCRFCQRFWISVLISVLLSVFVGFQLETILIPFLVIGIYQVANNEG